MDIAGLSIAMHQSTLQNQVQISLMKMTMDNSNIINENMNDMMENMTVETNVGVNLDVTV